MKLYCCQCGKKVEARLTNGLEVYPHRIDLGDLPFWKCDTCGNHVGCHHKTNNPTRPLGNISTKEIRQARQHIHRILDPLWKQRRIKRKELYAMLSNMLGWEYHTAKIKSVEEAREVYKAVLQIRKEIP